MKVAIDASPLKNQHNTRGIGSYTQNLIESFKRLKEGIELEQFYDPKNPPNVDVVHYPYFDFYFNTLPIFKKQKRVVTIHDVIPLVFPDKFPAGLKGRFNLQRQKLALKNTDAVICDSVTSKQDIINKLGYPQDKIHAVYLAQGKNFKKINDKKLLNKISKKYKLPLRFILYVGDVNWNKNLPNLLEASKLADVNLVMVGKAILDENLEQTKSLISKMKSIGISEKVLRLGYIQEEDLISIYNLASATLVPSFYEGFGLPVLESMTCGTPVICSKNSSLTEIAEEAAIYCDPNDSKDIALKINQTIGLKKPDLSERLISHAKKFSWEKVATETIRVYKKVALE